MNSTTSSSPASSSGIASRERVLPSALLGNDTVLVIEDDRQVRKVLQRNLGAAGFRVHASEFGRHGLIEIARRQADIVILDLNLPDMDGVAVIRELRAWSPVPVMVLSARDDEASKIAALNAGADDYMVKPFSFGELEARLRAALRRRKSECPDVESLRLDGLTIDFARRLVRVQERSIHLAPIEFRLLATLARNAGRITTHRALLLAVWGPTHLNDAHYLRVHMSNLRKKIESDPVNPRYILTEPTIGYRLAAT